eukprot:COSAG01_NODE_1050_length_11922_cov_8.014632_6_plen_125_part_00
MRDAWGEVKRQMKGGHLPDRAVFGLCCTHYGYSHTLWEKAIAAEIGPGIPVECVDPNKRFADDLFKSSPVSGKITNPMHRPVCRVNCTVESNVQLTTEIGALSPSLSTVVASALAKYVFTGNEH